MEIQWEKLPAIISELSEKVRALENQMAQFTKPETIEEPIPIEAAAAFLGLSKQSVYQRCSKRTIPSHKTGKHLRFFKSELSDYVRSKKQHFLKN